MADWRLKLPGDSKEPDDVVRGLPPDADPVESQRQGFDLAQKRERSKSDRFRLDQRLLRDRTRQNQRGDLQAQESLRRERQTDDDSLSTERESANLVRREEHKLSDATLAREKQARGYAEETSRVGLDRESSRAKELLEVLGLVQAQLLVVSTNLGALMRRVPKGELRGLAAESVGAVRGATDRVKKLVDDVLDPGDTRRRYHDTGGEG